MTAFRDVSGTVRTPGSDIDVELWIPANAWKIATAALSRLHLGHYKRSKTYRIEIGTVELFLIDETEPDAITLALASNLEIQRSWSDDQRAAYTADKLEISHLTGTDRKRAKARIAVKHGLNPIVYRA